MSLNLNYISNNSKLVLRGFIGLINHPFRNEPSELI